MDGVAGRPADMAKSSEWRTDFGRFWLRRGTGFARLDGRKDCAMLGTETGEVSIDKFESVNDVLLCRLKMQSSKQKQLWPPSNGSDQPLHPAYFGGCCLIQKAN